MQINYIFEPKWKEELICKCSEGSFILDYAMGVPTVYFPAESRWEKVSPEWAKTHWNSLHEQLQEWCKNNNTVLALDIHAEYPL